MTAARNQKWYSYQKKWYLSHFGPQIKILMRKCRVRFTFLLPRSGPAPVTLTISIRSISYVVACELELTLYHRALWVGFHSETLTSLTQLHVPELEYLYEVGIGTPHRPTGHRRVLSQRQPCATRYGPHRANRTTGA